MNVLEKLKVKPVTTKRVPVQVNLDPIDWGDSQEGSQQANPIPSEPSMIIVDDSKKEFDRRGVLENLRKIQVNMTKQTQHIPKDDSDLNPEDEDEPIQPKKRQTQRDVEQDGVEPRKRHQDAQEDGVEPTKRQPQQDAREDGGVEPKKPKKQKDVQAEPVLDISGQVTKIGDTTLIARLPEKMDPIIVKVDQYYMNNREIFVGFINSLFDPYKNEISKNTDEISCDTIGNRSSEFSLLTHQKIVRDYMNLYTPYRGLLLYHGLGSGKTASSIAIAEGMKDGKGIIVMTPASLRANYIEELKKAGDVLYNKNQFWEWISTEKSGKNKDIDSIVSTISSVLSLPEVYIRKQKGAWFINISKPANYDNLTDIEKKSLDKQLDEMIKQKYTFINYNGLRTSKLKELTSDYTENLFDNKVVIIDEAHNLVSRIVNKLGKGKKKEHDEEPPTTLATRLYDYLLSARNVRIVLLTGTPVINYPNEFAIIFNILRGYIPTWEIPLIIASTGTINTSTLKNILSKEKTHDYLDYSPSSKVLTITRNPYGFKNKILKKDDNLNYKGVKSLPNDVHLSDAEFLSKIIYLLQSDTGHSITINKKDITVRNNKALPDNLENFYNRYIDDNTGSLKNVDSLKRRIIGLSSYFKSAQENLLPKFNKEVGVDYHINLIDMSDSQFKIYESARKDERKTEKPKKQKPGSDESSSSTYRIFSRLFCNFAMPNRPMPKEDALNADLLKEGRKELDLNAANEAEIEGDEILDKFGGDSYKKRIQDTLTLLKDHSDEYLTPQALQTYSPKFLKILENIKNVNHEGLHLLYSQFRTLEGIGIFSLVLDANGFTRFMIKKDDNGKWKIDIPDQDLDKPTYALYTGTETTEEKELLRHIYNGEWDLVPETISTELFKRATDNNTGQVIKVFMITSAGSEGINLRNTRYVHIMEPYWHPVRSEQVIGRARRICSHTKLPTNMQTVEVFVYLMQFTDQQLKSGEAVELKTKDLSKMVPKIPFTSDQTLFEISELKAKLTSQLTNIVKDTAFDCFIYNDDTKQCVNFGDGSSSDDFSYVPDLNKQQNDIISNSNKVKTQWTGQKITIDGIERIGRKMSNTLYEIYELNSYYNNNPLRVGTVTIDANGTLKFKGIS